MVVRFQVLTAASMMFRAVFWVILHGSITQKTALNIKMVLSNRGHELICSELDKNRGLLAHLNLLPSCPSWDSLHHCHLAITSQLLLHDARSNTVTETSKLNITTMFM
jgi:hypothetical protein